MQTMNIQDLLDRTGFSRFQWRIFLFTFAIAFFDGYDTAVIGYIAPSLMGEWGIAKADLAPVLSAALFGLAFGAIAFGPVADKIGRKWVLLLSVLLFSVGTLSSAWANDLRTLEILRFMTGIGLGAAMPNAVTLLSEYCPKERRAFIVNTMFCGFPLGAASGGFIASFLIPQLGWHSMLILGGLIPLLLTFVMLFSLPESIRFLYQKEGDSPKVRAILARINPEVLTVGRLILSEMKPATSANIHQNNQESKSVETGSKSKFKSHHSARKGLLLVLTPPYLLGSLMLWIAYFMGLVIFYSVMNWMPTLFQESGVTGGMASTVTGLFALGGLGAIMNGYLMDRFNGTKLIAGLYFLTAISVALMGLMIDLPIVLLIIVTLFAGIVMNSAQSSLPALAAQFYPTAGRTTGVSMMLGLGRFGGIVGSFLVALLVAKGLTIVGIFYFLAIPALIAVIALLIKAWWYR